ncbi:hypothetical protein VNO80_02343 [Phaseolus coccineus]|uniref:Plus3 domain-containing protein n=1 Tax=Phaseolus coccineus TaxID=3886 RepID=A0AAN9RRH6_PHACN
MENLLARHFAENFEEMCDISSSEDRDYNEPSNLSRKRKLISFTKSHNLNIVCEEHQSCFAAIVSYNLKLVYWKRSLVDELSKQPQTFDDKVLESYVRIKTDPCFCFVETAANVFEQLSLFGACWKLMIDFELLLQLTHNS